MVQPLKRWSRGREDLSVALLVLVPCSLQPQKAAAESWGPDLPRVHTTHCSPILCPTGAPEEAGFPLPRHFWLLGSYTDCQETCLFPSSPSSHTTAVHVKDHRTYALRKGKTNDLRRAMEVHGFQFPFCATQEYLDHVGSPPGLLMFPFLLVPSRMEEGFAFSVQHNSRLPLVL